MIVKPFSKKRKWFVIAGLMLAGFSLAFLVAKAARNDLAALAPRDHSGVAATPQIKADE